MTSSFLTPLDMRLLDGGETWQILARFAFGSAVLGRVIEIAAGFVTDFASSPRLAWSIVPPTGPYGKAAVVHDYLYRTPGMGSRAQADAVFLEAMTILGVGWVKRRAMYAAVRLGGRRRDDGTGYQGDDVPITVDASGHPLA